MAKILVLHGPNLNLLGTREPELYGQETLSDINGNLRNVAGYSTILCHQSNSEAELIELIHGAKGRDVAGIIFNPAAFSHTSIALRDAVLAVNLPMVEVHISNVYQREPFRKHSYFSDIAVGSIVGLGHKGYEFALQFLLDYLER
jgi:3-dehydroquinate dehydratase-2